MDGHGKRTAITAFLFLQTSGERLLEADLKKGTEPSISRSPGLEAQCLETLF